MNGLGGQTSFWVAELQYEFQWAICSDGRIQNGFLNKPPIFYFRIFRIDLTFIIQTYWSWTIVNCSHHKQMSKLEMKAFYPSLWQHHGKKLVKLWRCVILEGFGWKKVYVPYRRYSCGVVNDTAKSPKIPKPPKIPSASIFINTFRKYTLKKLTLR